MISISTQVQINHQNNGQEMSFENALAVLREQFGAYMDDNVLSKVTVV